MNNYLTHGKSAQADFDPANYTYVTTGYNWDCGEDFAEYVNSLLPDYTEDEHNVIWQAYCQKEPWSGLRAKGQGGKCQHCGKFLHWFVLYRDVRTGHLLVTGTQCAQELDLPDKGALVRKERAEAVARATKLAKFDLSHPGLRQELERVVLAERPERAYFFTFLSDLTHKINRYFEISEKQAETVKRFLNQGLDRIAEREAKRATEPAAQPIPAAYNGNRVALKGTILGTKEVENDFGTSTKILFQSDEGFKLWGTCNHNCGKGDRISFTGRVEISAKDPAFGFFSRPTKIEITSQEEVAA